MSSKDPGVSKYIFKDKTVIKAPNDYTDYLNADEIKAMEKLHGPLVGVFRKDVGPIAVLGCRYEMQKSMK